MGEGDEETKKEIFAYYIELKSQLFPESKPKPEITCSSLSTQTIINYIREYTEMFITQKIKENEELQLANEKKIDCLEPINGHAYLLLE